MSGKRRLDEPAPAAPSAPRRKSSSGSGKRLAKRTKDHVVCAMILTDDEFRLFSQLIYNESGIAIKDAKRDFLQARLQKRLQANQCNSYYRYYKYVTDQSRGNRELLDLVDSLTINETSFFRNRPQFDLFAEHVLPELKRKKSGNLKLRFWSAGCSRGQEAYSIAMSVLDHLELPNAWDIKILASDISLRVLESAQRGQYSEYEAETVHSEYLKTYFDKVDNYFQIKPQVRKLVIFDYHNLKHDNGLVGLDAVFCRNVMIYFDPEEQKRLIDKLHRSLADGGYLFLGHTESIQGLSDKFKFIYRNKGAVYQKIG
jgi:chemotaxis protein methyltransferase CheR